MRTKAPPVDSEARRELARRRAERPVAGNRCNYSHDTRQDKARNSTTSRVLVGETVLPAFPSWFGEGCDGGPAHMHDAGNGEFMC